MLADSEAPLASLRRPWRMVLYGRWINFWLMACASFLQQKQGLNDEDILTEVRLRVPSRRNASGITCSLLERLCSPGLQASIQRFGTSRMERRVPPWKKPNYFAAGGRMTMRYAVSLT